MKSSCLQQSVGGLVATVLRVDLTSLADYIAEQTGIQITDETVRQFLKADNLVLSRPQHKITSLDPKLPGKKRRLKRPVTT